MIHGVWFFLSRHREGAFAQAAPATGYPVATPCGSRLAYRPTPRSRTGPERCSRPNDAIHTVIFGHTHIAMCRQVFPGRSYLNSGSWIPNANLHISSLGRSLAAGLHLYRIRWRHSPLSPETVARPASCRRRQSWFDSGDCCLAELRHAIIISQQITSVAHRCRSLVRHVTVYTDM